MIGILPTLQAGHLTPSTMSVNPRYRLLSEQILHARGEDIRIDVTGPERLITTTDSILPEAACTSTQFHVQTSPEQFAAYWNASQAIAAVQLAVGANSPFCLGKELWRETRIPLFEQAADTRSEELKAQGVRPRVWFGERWINSVFDLFEENVRYFSALLPITSDEDPVAVLESGETPQLSELRLHNGTIYRWNRPVYDITDGTPHLRVENRILPAGPTVADLVANAAFYFGLVRHLAESDRPLWSQMSFQAAHENFETAAEDGIDASIYWPGIGQVKATELVLRRLLPLAQAGLESWGVDGPEVDRLLGHHRAALPARRQRRELVRRPGAPSHRRRPLRRPARDAAGVRRADAHQRAGAHLGLSAPLATRQRPTVRGSVATPGRTPVRGSTQPCRVTTTYTRSTSFSSALRSSGPSQAASTSWRTEAARPGQPRGRVATDRAQRGPDDVGAQPGVPGRGRPHARAGRPPGVPTWSTGGEVAAPFAGGQGEHGPRAADARWPAGPARRARAPHQRAPRGPWARLLRPQRSLCGAGEAVG